MSPEEWLKQKEQNSKDTSLESFGAPGTTKEDIKAGRYTKIHNKKELHYFLSSLKTAS